MQIDQVKLDEEVHRRQRNLASRRVQGVQHLPQMTHGLLLSRQGIDERLSRHEVIGTKLSEIPAGVSESIRNVGDGPENVGPVDGGGGDENLQQ